MIEQHARVVSVQGDQACVRTENPSGCSSCSAKSGCGSALVAQMFPGRNRGLLTLPVDHLPRAPRPGERVVIGIDENYLQRATLLLYAVPLLGLIGGAIGGEQLAQSLYGAGTSELGAILGSLSGLSMALAWVRHRAGRRGRGEVRILRIDPAATSVAIRDLGLHA